MASIKSIATGELYASALDRITGARPDVVQNQDHVLLRWAPSEQIKARAWVEQQLSPGKPGDVRVDLLPVILPSAAKRLIPAAVVCVVMGYVAGKLL
jgi:hypothetical protein